MIIYVAVACVKFRCLSLGELAVSGKGELKMAHKRSNDVCLLTNKPLQDSLIEAVFKINCLHCSYP